MNINNLEYAIMLSIKLACFNALILIPVCLSMAKFMLNKKTILWILFETVLLLPMVLPPTVIGFYILLHMGQESFLGQFFHNYFDWTFVFNLKGLILATLIINFPFSYLPIKNSLAQISSDYIDIGRTSGLKPLSIFFKIEIPLIKTSLLSTCLLTMAHTVGEFGAVTMVGGNIPGITQTVSMTIYDSVQAFEFSLANRISLGLLVISYLIMSTSLFLNNRKGY